MSLSASACALTEERTSSDVDGGKNISSNSSQPTTPCGLVSTTGETTGGEQGGRRLPCTDGRSRARRTTAPSHTSSTTSSSVATDWTSESKRHHHHTKQPGLTYAPQGQLSVTVLGARNLLGISPNSRPYPVISFDKNEYISTTSAMSSPNNPRNPVWNDHVTFDSTTTKEAKVYVSVYDYHTVHSDDGFIGMCDILPLLQENRTSERWYDLITAHHASDPADTTLSQVRVKLHFVRRSRRKLTTRDFEYIKLIGKGTFGRVFQVRKKNTRRIYAMKVLSKRQVVNKKEVVHIMDERKIMEQSLSCPFLLGLKFSFQSETKLFLVTDYKAGGELWWHLQREGRFTEERSRFYTAELILALEHLHKYDIVYRDLKPENILLDATGHIALCDFGLSKANLANGQLTNTFCGTTEFLAPEILLDESGYSKLVDFWSLGVLLFEMCCGWSPFYAEDIQQLYRNICFGKIRFPRGAISDQGKQFVKELLNRNPKHRLGAKNDAQDLKSHPFFTSLDWDLLAQKKVPPPFKPLVEHEASVENFDPHFTATDLRSIVRDHNDGVSLAEDAHIHPDRFPPDLWAEDPLSPAMQQPFRGFSYCGSRPPTPATPGTPFTAPGTPAFRSRRGSFVAGFSGVHSGGLSMTPLDDPDSAQ